MTDAEWSELLLRHREVSEQQLGDGAECWFVLNRGGGGVEWVASALGMDVAFGEVSVEGEEPGCHPDLGFAVVGVAWNFERFLPLLRARANDEFRDILFANLENGQIYAPYDGGADLVFPPERDVADVKTRFTAWLSVRADGL